METPPHPCRWGSSIPLRLEQNERQRKGEFALAGRLSSALRHQSSWLWGFGTWAIPYTMDPLVLGPLGLDWSPTAGFQWLPACRQQTSASITGKSTPHSKSRSVAKVSDTRGWSPPRSQVSLQEGHPVRGFCKNEFKSEWSESSSVQRNDIRR